MGKYTRKTQRGSFSSETIDAALKAIIEDGRKVREVARAFEIHEATLRRKLKIRNLMKESKSESLGRAPVFSQAQENDIVDHVLNLANLFFGITSMELRTMVFKYAEQNKIKHHFNNGKQMAGKDWFQGFLRRNPKISLRKPETTSVNRITAFNKTEVERYFQNLQRVQEKYKFLPDRIYNVDESGISTVPKESNKRLGPKGIKQFGIISSWERGKNITVICAFSASGSYIPPLFVFPRKRMSPQLQKNGPSGAIYTCTDNGWSNESVFSLWLKHFQSKILSSPDNPVLLILDNHSSHISLQIYEYCKKNGIVMVSIPPHTSHKLQPLDVTFFAALKNAYSRHCNSFLKSKITNSEFEDKITPYDVAEIFKLAYDQVANIEKAVSGFKACGIFPLNCDKFTEDDFAPADNLNSNLDRDISSEPKNKSLPPPLDQRTSPQMAIRSSTRDESPQPSTSKQLPPIHRTPTKQNSPKQRQHISITLISPVPVPTKKSKKNSRQKQHSEILTSTPLKEVLEAKENKKQEKLAKSEEAKKKATKKIYVDDASSKTQIDKNVGRKQVQSTKKKKITKKIVEDSETEESNFDEKDLCDDDELDDMSDEGSKSDLCVICGDIGRKSETWFRCTNCGHWVHKECSGADGPENYVCDLC